MKTHSFYQQAALTRYGHDIVNSSDAQEKRDYITSKTLTAYVILSQTASISYTSHDELGGKTTAISDTLGIGTMFSGKMTNMVVTSGKVGVYFAKDQMEDRP